MLAIIGGTGRLPDLMAERMPDAPRFAPRGTPYGGGAHAAEPFRFERIGGLIERLRALQVDRLVLVGGMRRPDLDPAAFDVFTRAAVAEIGPALGGGDDALLRAVIGLFDREGFEVTPVQEILTDLLPPPGVATEAPPDAQDAADAARGLSLLAALGPYDVGQACAVARGQVLAIETLGGTDWMLGTLAGEVPGRPLGGPNGVLCKAPKPMQDRRVDLPAIGPATIAAAAAASLRGVAIETGGVLGIDWDECVARADAAGLFLWVRPV
jgi:DUF1009 family protein